MFLFNEQEIKRNIKAKKFIRSRKVENEKKKPNVVFEITVTF